MDSYILDVLNFLVRSVHVIAGIAWIGASFYFVMLDTSLTKPEKKEDQDNGVFGELWAVHGGGFYHSQKYLLGPHKEPLSDNLHWSKWEAYTTWISGFFLMAIVYWYSAEIYLIDSQIYDISKAFAVVISLCFVLGGFVVYHLLCQSLIAKNEKILFIIIFSLLFISAYILTQLFSGRGAFMTFGAMLGTIMAANVYFVIIPGQQAMVECLRNNKPVDPLPGIAGKQRSVHNTYFTLPVLFVMISNHYAMTYGHEYNWLILIAISVAGALIRGYFVSRHRKSRNLNEYLWAAIIILICVFWIMSPKSVNKLQISSETGLVPFNKVQSIIESRCTTCHSNNPSYPGFLEAPKGYKYNTEKEIKDQAFQIYQQAVVLKTMPIANVSGMTDEERQLINTWYQQIKDTGE